jgi:D-alanyl-D-alanine carboxypeptidase/D-alanyl-D-alanine-endopeptidase (penicillin-binding protein 4)
MRRQRTRPARAVFFHYVSLVRRHLIAAVVVSATAILPAATASAADLTAVQSKLTREMRLAGPSAGAVVRDLDSGRTIFALRADSQRVPASVEKLFVSAAAFMRDGAEARIPTRVLAGAPPQAGVVAGPLYLVGRGDPTLSRAGIKQLAANVKAAGITQVQGGIRGDDSAFDHRVGSPDSNFAYDRELGGLLTGLAVNRGWDAKGLQSAPAASAARRLARELGLLGVTVSGTSTAGTAPQSATEVTRVTSAPMSEIVAAMNGPSDNYLAEMLLKGLGATHGAGGTTAAGAKAAQDTLDDIGVRPRIVDGSGLSRRDRTTPRQVVRLLQRAANMEFAVPFTASLPIAGQTGTLQRRMRGTAAAGACRAKTGTLRYTSNLAGYCTTGDGGVVAFALLMNGVNVGTAHKIQDHIAASLAGWDGLGAGPDMPAPAAPVPATPEPTGAAPGGTMAPPTA